VEQFLSKKMKDRLKPKWRTLRRGERGMLRGPLSELKTWTGLSRRSLVPTPSSLRLSAGLATSPDSKRGGPHGQYSWNRKAVSWGNDYNHKEKKARDNRQDDDSCAYRDKKVGGSSGPGNKEQQHNTRNPGKGKSFRGEPSSYYLALVQNFDAEICRGMFSVLALSMLGSTGLDIAQAVYVAGQPIG
jgi:hypothetical protein